VGIFGNQQNLQLSRQLILFCIQRAQLVERQVTHVGIAAVHELFGLRDGGHDASVFAVGFDERLELSERLGLFAVLVGVVLYSRRPERSRQLLILALERNELVEHSETSNGSTGRCWMVLGGGRGWDT